MGTSMENGAFSPAGLFFFYHMAYTSVVLPFWNRILTYSKYSQPSLTEFVFCGCT